MYVCPTCVFVGGEEEDDGGAESSGEGISDVEEGEEPENGGASKSLPLNKLASRVGRGGARRPVGAKGKKKTSTARYVRIYVTNSTRLQQSIFINMYSKYVRM